MTQIKESKSGLRTLTQEEVDATSGGFFPAWFLPAVGAAIVKFAVESILKTVKGNLDKGKDDPNHHDHDKGCYDPYDNSRRH